VVKAGLKYELLATNAMGQPLLATPAISDRLIIVRGENTITRSVNADSSEAEGQPRSVDRSTWI